jgi:hypothetical protein
VTVSNPMTNPILTKGQVCDECEEQLHDVDGVNFSSDLIESKFEKMHKDEELWFDAPL